MGMFLQTFLIGVGLAMDAFAVSVCKGLGMTKINRKQMVVIGLYFGGFQALMPLLGWLLGSGLSGFITETDHWIAFGLLFFIGGKMLYEALKGEEEEAIEIKDKPIDHKDMVMLAVATSIDALAAGVVFATDGTPIIFAMIIIGVSTMVICMIGVVIGNYFGDRFRKGAEITGGCILILIGLKILLEGLGIWMFVR